ncbi:hypothetical protein A8C32_10180 [Flavivirga aquatica]|uniref:Uncharacterized protein n=1 Tax=Flavivirga aquatica TaxID=1849968 RepID=A0A1E5TEU5_9FLAO|nr:hypothetical protein [Flavivirga aquatica]OEK09868.1 hypothetical protein A8C32_10180 [Flavivirga aquatica]
MKKGILFFISLSILFSCHQDDDNNPVDQNLNKVLLLKVDYLTNTFENGTELTFKNTTSSFTIKNEYTTPGDFGNIKLTYKELNETLFDGSIIWLGSGKRNFPATLLDSNTFEEVKTEDFLTPKSGFENIFNPHNETYDYNPIWASVQKLAKVRDYLKSNPNATVKLFLYTPSVGVGNPKEWDWYIFIKN